MPSRYSYKPNHTTYLSLSNALDSGRQSKDDPLEAQIFYSGNNKYFKKHQKMKKVYVDKPIDDLKLKRLKRNKIEQQ